LVATLRDGLHKAPDVEGWSVRELDSCVMDNVPAKGSARSHGKSRHTKSSLHGKKSSTKASAATRKSSGKAARTTTKKSSSKHSKTKKK